MPILENIKEATIRGDRDNAVELSKKAIAEGFKVDDIIQKGLIAAMGVVGDRFKKGEIFVPEMLIAARAMQAGLGIVKPYLTGDEKVTELATVVLGTVKGDLHDIGKNLVGMMLEGAGCVVVDLGNNVPPEKFVNAVREHKPHFLGLSSLLTTTMPGMRIVLEKLEEAGLRQQVKVLVGGAPVTQKFADEIGADGYASNASVAVDKIKELLGVSE